MFDINAIINNAIATAVADATAPLVARIEVLELWERRVTALETRLLALESNPAIGVDTTLEQRVAALENIAAEYTPAPAVTIDEAKMVEALNSQEWFWEKMQRRIDAATERAMEEHTEEYNHDSYDDAISKVEDIDFDELVKTDYLSEAVRDAVQDLSFEIRVR